ncbi:O-antigen ligase family protein [Mycobacterium vicinigordonae]|uniref:O-antigen ligase family protein n=1 Tax=Mycobacterium vicinigordonae TaxID=1719132 RepID=A0A7D6E1R3_9MYCO|nr:O-antigen ligase family protein [Mycobacterium vicinigordonae]QLL06566.1 O-antigen ligase family protein [Mycobacterium vicinigordonae]
MIVYLRTRHRLAMAAAVLALFGFGCFVYGALSVRNTTQGILLVGLTFFLIVYWAKPELMIGLALFLGCAALPQGLHVGKVIGPVSIYASHVVLILAICFVLPVVRLRMSDYLLPGMFGIVVIYFAAVGFSTGHHTGIVVREATFLFEMLAGFVLALVVVYGDYVILSIHAMAFTLWFSAGMAILGSSGGIRLAGRTESLQADTGDAANRVITSSLIPAIAVLTALVAAQIAGRVKPSAYLALGLPALVIAVLAFSRNTILSVGVAAVVAFFASMGWSAVRRAARLTLTGAGILAVTIPLALFLLGDSTAGVWLANQITGFSHRVLGRSTGTALTEDPSTLARFAEDRHLNDAIAAAPVFGHGLGYAYQLPFGGDDPSEFTQTLGTTYAHNFYLWWLAKSGAIGMTGFAVFALTPLVRALRSASVPAKVSAATSVGLLVMCVIDPLPEDPANSMTLGIALGAAMAFATLGRRRVRPELEEPATDDYAARPASVPDGVAR